LKKQTMIKLQAVKESNLGAKALCRTFDYS